jgi:type IV pilus assembly protein PilC
MLEGGLPITAAVETVASEMENPYFEDVLRDIALQLENGTPISECVRAYPRVFNTLSCAMMQAGESSGSLNLTLERLTTYYENKDKLGRKVKGALAYPMFVVVFIILIVVALMTFIIPRFTVMFDEMEGELPAFTKGFMAVYNIIMSNAPFVIVACIGLTVAIGFYSKTDSGHYRLCRIGLKVPIFGKIKIQAFVATFCRTLSTLISSGVPILEAFDILANMTANDVFKIGVLETRERLVEGSSVSASMSAGEFFPDVAVKMAQIGEQSGSLPDVLEKASEYYEKKVDVLVSAMLGLMEPILIVSVGSIVLLVVLAMYMPIFTMGG